MLVRDMKTSRTHTCVQLRMRLPWTLVLMIMVVLSSGLRAQEAETQPEQQPAKTTEPTETKTPSSPRSDTASIVADIVARKDVSTEALRQIHIPDELLRPVSSDLHADMKYMNRRITRFRAQIMGSVPETRSLEAAERIEKQVDSQSTSPVDSVYIEQGVVIRIGGKVIFAITKADLDLVAGETLEGRAEEAIANLEKALQEAKALRQPYEILRSSGRALVITLAYALWIWLLLRLEKLIQRKMMQLTGRTLKGSIAGEIAADAGQKVKIVKYARRLVHVFGVLLILVSTYLWFSTVLQRFPYTRPWGEKLGAYLLDVAAWIGTGIAEAIPGLFIVAVIYFLARASTRLITAIFTAVEEERLAVPGLYPETAQPTRKLATVAVWLLAVVVAYPYLPGSGTDAFKGLSVFVGLVVSLGSTGVVNQAMSGFMLMYSRALRIGDWVQVGEVEGEVLDLAMLSTKVRTRAGEEVTVPNAVVISKETVNYTRFAEAGVTTGTTVTIGYDTPWRQVHALLEQAAAQTPGLRQKPPPFVLQTGLSDWYPEYQLKAVIDNPPERPRVLSDLHKNIQDLFNEYGVQIMSPHYINDPPEPFLVPPDRRSPAPAPTEDSVQVETDPNPES